MLLVEGKHGIHVIAILVTVRKQGILHLDAALLVRDGLVVPPRMRGDENGFAVFEIAVDRLLEDVLRAVAEHDGFLVDGIVGREAF